VEQTNSAAGAREELVIETAGDVVRVRQAVRAMAQKAALSIVDQTKLVTAASELARNTLIHGGGGNALLEELEEGGRAGIRATFSDSGPGIKDLPLAMTDGYTSGGGLGLGLSGSRRLVDAFELDSKVGVGTRVTVTKWKR
jgi:serine/threonine-protein kinase RsbT